MNHICKYASSGCNSPEGECVGLCEVKAKHTPEQAQTDLKNYARAMRTDNYMNAVGIERAWGLYGYTPEIVSTVLACVATGLPLDAAINETTGSTA